MRAIKAEKSGGGGEAIDCTGYGEVGLKIFAPLLSQVGPNEPGFRPERRESSQGLMVAQVGEGLALVPCLKLLEALRRNDHAGEYSLLLTILASVLCRDPEIGGKVER